MRSKPVRKATVLIAEGNKICGRKFGGKWLEVKREECTGIFEHLQRLVNDVDAGIEQGLRLQGQCELPDEGLEEYRDALRELFMREEEQS